MRMSDLVAQYIIEMLDRENGSSGDSAKRTRPATSDVYRAKSIMLLTSRFTPEKGYIVESRRGGGGFIRISRVKMDRGTALMHIINSIGTTLDKASAEAMLKNMLQRDMIELTSARLIASALSDRTLTNVEQSKRDAVRADLFKNMLLTLS